MKGLGAKVLLLILSLSSISFSRANLACNGYVSPSTGESVASPLWGSAAAKQATSQTNATNPFFMCFTALATYTYPNNTKKGFAVFGGIPGGDQYWYNGVGGTRPLPSDPKPCLPALSSAATSNTFFPGPRHVLVPYRQAVLSSHLMP